MNAALEQRDGRVRADGDIAAGDMKASRDFLVGEPLVEAQLDDLAAGSWQQINHFPLESHHAVILSPAHQERT